MPSALQRTTCLAVGALLVVAAASPPAEGAARRHGPDLVAQVKIDDLGTPPHILLGASGAAPRFRVEMTTTNKGDRVAKSAGGALVLEDRATKATVAIYRWKETVPARDSLIHVAYIADRRFSLGFTDVTGRADIFGSVHDTNPSNNNQTKTIAVEPREWDVSKWETEGVGNGIDTHTDADQGFFLRFQKYDHGFVYQAYGSATAAPKSYPGCASVTGSKSLAQTPWPASRMTIDADLLKYSAFVPKPADPSFFATCNLAPSVSFQIQDAFLDLSTGPASSKTPQAAILEGVDSQSSPGGSTSWIWKFAAHLPHR